MSPMRRIAMILVIAATSGCATSASGQDLHVHPLEPTPGHLVTGEGIQRLGLNPGDTLQELRPSEVPASVQAAVLGDIQSTREEYGLEKEFRCTRYFTTSDEALILAHVRPGCSPDHVIDDGTSVGLYARDGNAAAEFWVIADRGIEVIDPPFRYREDAELKD